MTTLPPRLNHFSEPSVTLAAPGLPVRSMLPCRRRDIAKPRLSNSIHRLLPLFDRARGRNLPLVLGTVVNTAGPTYTKAGAQMLMSADGETAGLLSGGCLE